ncbi:MULTISPECIES: S26 family signal peptidase [unclassified Kitasatospora]|uniref:S26 family signal peptidase n=1 Tax=unclassified Kitasatospora TaxID=2633591 RepID=UPI0033D25C9C
MVVAPVDPSRLEPGDIVLARVAGTVYLHLVSSIDPARKRVHISNNRGRINGWTHHDRVFGICVAVDGVLRAGAADKTLAADPDNRPGTVRGTAKGTGHRPPCRDPTLQQ